MNAKKQTLNLTVTGPAGAGKGTASLRLASKLGIIHIDAGFIFRFGTYCSFTGMLGPLPELVRLHREGAWGYICTDQGPLIRAGRRELARELRDPVMGMLTAETASKPEFFKHFKDMVEVAIESYGRVIVDGRSAGTLILPNADVKFYITANVEVRAQRQISFFAKSGFPIDPEKVIKDIKERDALDMTRPVDPLRIPDGAVVVDNSDLTEKETVDRMILALSERGLA